MVKNNVSFMQNHLNKMNFVFKIVLSLLALLEFTMMIRGFLLFDFERLKHRLYLYSYISLFVTSLTALILFFLWGKNEKHTKKISIATYVYAFCIIAWSAFVSCVDCYANGDSGIIVFVITCYAVGIITLIKPQVFIPYLFVNSAFLIFFTAFIKNWTFYSSGFYINFFVFMLTAIFINVHNYSLSKREYEANRKLHTLSYTDQLTGVFNRRSLDKQTAKFVESNTPFTFVLLDIDDFKQVNDTFGHPKGDACLVHLAEKLTEHFGERVYRFGGDEFAILSTLDTRETCAHLDAVNDELKNGFENISLQISAGVYSFESGDLSDRIFAKSDKALYAAKQTGKARWSLYEEQNN